MSLVLPNWNKNDTILRDSYSKFKILILQRAEFSREREREREREMGKTRCRESSVLS